MALAALIIASEEVEDGGDELRATLPLLGRTLVEHQVRQAAAAGARHAVLLVERLPAELIAAVDRLRRDHVAVEIARTIAHAADRFHPDERVLVIADGCAADQAMVDAAAALAPSALMTLPDHADAIAHERIDARCRWAGLALLDGAAVRSTAAMLGDWDPQSTLLRRAVQAGARRIDAGQSVGEAVRIAVNARALDGLDRRLLQASRLRWRRWPRRWLFAPVEGPAAGRLAGRAVDPLWVAAGAAALAVIGAAAALLGWAGTGLGFGLLSGPAAAVAARLGRVRLSEPRREILIERVRAGALGVGLFGIAATLGDWGWLLAAGGVLAAMLLLTMAVKGLIGLSNEKGPPWIADADGLTWTLLPVALLGGWGVGIAVLLGYAAVSLARMQWLLVAAATGSSRPDTV